MNTDISAILPRHGRRMLAALGFFAVALCCAAVLIVNHFQESLGSELLREFALSQVRHLGDAPEGGAPHLLNALSTHGRDHFVMERIVDGNGTVTGEEVAPAFGGIASSLESCRTGQSGAEADACQQDTADGARYFFVREPLGVGDWAFEGIFRASPKTVHAVDSIYLTVVAAVVATLVASLLLMYPTVRLLESSLRGSNRRLLQANLDMLKALGCAIAKRDSDTEDHNFRVTLYAIRIAERMGLEAAHIRSLIKGALLHDVGKIAVRDDILLKPGPLDAEEIVEMRRHVHYGLEIIASSGWLVDAREVVEGHHEKFDGTGYPNGLSGEAIPLSARVFAVADVFDALTSRRPYKAALPVPEVVAMLAAERGRHFDPAVLDTFFSVLAEGGDSLSRLNGALAERAVGESIARYFGIPARSAARREGFVPLQDWRDNASAAWSPASRLIRFATLFQGPRHRRATSRG